MKRLYGLIALAVFSATSLMAQDDHIGDGLASVAAIAGETKTVETPQDSVNTPSVLNIPVWKQKLYYGYKFDIYYHTDSRSTHKDNGLSITLTPEIGWKLSEKMSVGMRFGGGYQHIYATYTDYDIWTDTEKTNDLRIQQGSWEVLPYMRYRLKTLFNDKVGIWLEAHLYAGMEFPRVTDGEIKGTDYDGLRHSIIYGAQVCPVITYQFNNRTALQIYFSILSLGYSGTTFCYTDPYTGKRYNETTNDVIIFSGKLRNLIANHLTPGLYGLRLGIQKSF